MNKFKLACVSACVMAVASSAFAAERAVPRKRVVAVAPVATWAGFYLGVNGGYGWGRSDVTPVGANAFCNPLLFGCPGAAGFLPGEVLAADVISAQAVPGTLSPHARGGLVGGTIGYNLQFGYWVAGLETDLAWSNIRGSDVRAGGPIAINPGAPAGVPITSIVGSATASNRLTDFGTLRGRLGFTPVAPLLIYGTGGLAYGQVSSDLVVGQAFIGPCGFAAGPLAGCPVSPATLSSSSIRVGYTVGGGAEYQLGGQWSVKAEYLYYDLGSKGYGTSTLTSIGTCPAACQFTIVNVTPTSNDFRGSIVRAGLNYRFGYAPTYATATK